MKMIQNATPKFPRNAVPMPTAYIAARRMMPSMRKAQEREQIPAGRSSSKMPSGVSVDTTVSRISPRSARASGLDDDRVGNVIVHAAPRVAEDEQDVDEAVERNHPEEPVDDVAPDDHAGGRHFGPVGAPDLDLEGLLADRLPVLTQEPDGEEHPDDEANARHRQPGPG